MNTPEYEENHRRRAELNAEYTKRREEEKKAAEKLAPAPASQPKTPVEE